MTVTNPGKRGSEPTQLDASGNGEGRITNNNSAALWIVRQISLISQPTRTGGICELRLPEGIIDTGYFAGTGSAAGGDPPIWLYGGDFIRLVWIGCAPNGQGVCTYFYDEVLL